MDINITKVNDLIGKNSKIGIVTGVNPNVDVMAAALSLYLSLIDAKKTVDIVSLSQPRVEVSSLVGIDKVQTQFGQGNGDMTVSFPCKEGEIEKVSYNLENNLLNIVIKAGQKGLSFTDKDIVFKRAGSVPSLLFIIGIQKLSDLNSLVDVASLKDTVLINIDNQVSNQGFGDVILCDPRHSSVSEQVASLIFSLRLPVNLDISQNLMSGINSATLLFQKNNIHPLAFEMAGKLIRSGARFQNNPQAFGQPKQATMTNPSGFTPFNKQSSLPPTTPPEDWLTPKVYKGSTTF